MCIRDSYQGDATWGLVDTDAQTKGYTSSNADDKDYTGVYGKNNEACLLYTSAA